MRNYSLMQRLFSACSTAFNPCAANEVADPITSHQIYRHWKRILACSVLAFALFGFQPVEALTNGDVAIVNFTAEGNDSLAFVALTNIPANTTIYFSDLGWTNSTRRYSTTEGKVRWSHSSDVSAGSVIIITNLSGGTVTANTGTGVREGSINLAGTDSLLVSESNSTVGIWHLFGVKWTTTWDTSTPLGGTAASQLPPEIANEQIVFSSADNFRYSRILTNGTKAELLTAITNTANWTISASGLTLTNLPFTVNNPSVCNPTGSITFVQQTGHYTKFTSGGDIFNSGSTNVGMWANSGSEQVAAWRNFRTDSSGGGDSRELQPGDRFRISVYGTAPPGVLGVSINDGASTASWADRHSNSRGYIQVAGGTGNDLYVTHAGGTPSWSGIRPNASAVTLVFDILSSHEFTANVEGQTPKYDLSMLNSPSDAARVDGFSIYLENDAGDVFWRQPTMVTNLGYVEFGADNGTRNIVGLITDSTDPACTNTASPNAVRKTGSGTVTIQHATNSFTKGTQIEAGTLAVYHDGNLGAAPGSSTTNVIIWSSGTLRATNSFTLNANRQIALGNVAGPSIDVDTGMTLTYGGVLGGDAQWNKKGSGVLALTGSSSTNKGRVDIQGGTLRISADGSLGAAPAATVTNIDIWSTGTFEIDANISLNTNRRVQLGTVTGPKYSVTTGNIATNGSLIMGTANWSKESAGTLVLNNDNSAGFSGTVTVNAGALRARHSNALGTTAGDVSVTGSAALELQGGITIPSGEDLTLNSSAAGGALRNISDNNTYAGAITLAGTTRINSDSGALTLDVTSGNAISGAYNLTLGGAGNIRVNDPIAITTGALIKADSGTTTIVGNNNYSGNTTVKAGLLELSGGVISNTAWVVVGDAAGTTASLIISNNGFFYSTNFFQVGAADGANSNSVSISSGGTLYSFRTLTVGQSNNASFNTLTVSNGTLIMSNTLAVGNGGTSGQSNNTGYVLSGGVVQMQNKIIISGSGVRNRWVIDGGIVSNFSAMNIGNAAGQQHIWTITNGGKAYGNTSSSSVFIGGSDGGASNALIVSGSGSLLNLGNVNNLVYIGGAGAATTGNYLRVTAGGVLSNCSVHVTGRTDQVFYLDNGGTAVVRSLVVSSGMSTWITNNGTLYIGGGGLRGSGTVTAEGSLIGFYENGNIDANLTLSGGSVTLQAAGQDGTANEIHIAGVLSGSGPVIKTGAGQVTLVSSSTSSGHIAVNAGIWSQYGTNTSAAIGVGPAGYLYGNGSAGLLTITGQVSAGVISNNVGQLETTGLNLENDGRLRVDITAMTGTPGTHWDVINVSSGSGTYTVNAVDGNDFIIALKGNPSFNNAIGYTNIIVDAGSASSFASSKFTVNTSEFTPSLGAGFFYVDASGGDLRLIFDPATVAAPDIFVKGTNDATITNGDATPSATDGTDFGQVYFAGARAVTNVFSITNSGTASLTVSSISTSSAMGAAADFTVLSWPTAVEAGTKSNLVISFNPSATGVRTALVTIANSDTTKNPYTFVLSGEGTGTFSTITFQGFEGSTSDAWNYNVVSNGAEVYVDGDTNASGEYAMTLRGSATLNADPYVEFDNIDISGYSVVTLQVAFAVAGADSGDDLEVDISYDNGSTWNGPGSTTLVFGASNTNLGFTGIGSSTVGTNPWYIDLPSTAQQVRVRVRFDESSNDNSFDRYFFDDIKLTGSGFAPQVSLGTTVYYTSETNGTLTVPVSISSSANATVQVVVAGTATVGGGNDYTMNSTNIIFTSGGATSSNVVFTFNDDTVGEGLENIAVRLIRGQGAIVSGPAVSSVLVQDDDAMTIMTANLTGGTNIVDGTFAYTESAERIIRRLRPDVLAIQEWKFTNASARAFVDSVLGTNYHFYIEPESDPNPIPNGVISRWPITASNQWTDSFVGARDYVHVTVDIPGARNLQVISIHLKAGPSDAATRESEARELTNFIAAASFPTNDYMVIAGDLNLTNRTETAFVVITQRVTDAHQSADQDGDLNTNLGRTSPYDYVLPNHVLDNEHLAINVGGFTYADGMVFDSEQFEDHLLPAKVNDSYEVNRTHMAVMKLFSISTAAIPPIVTTTIASSTNSTYAASGGNVTSDGGGTVTNRGVVWSTSATPTVPGSQSTNGTGTGSFSSTLTNLTPGATYFYRAFAQNHAGTGYGTEYSLTTPCFSGVVTGLIASVTNDTNFTAAWSNFAGASGYALDVSTDFSGAATIGIQDFEISPATPTATYSVSGGALVSGNSASGDRPASSPHASSATQAYSVVNGTATLTFDAIDTSATANPVLSMRLASFSVASTGNGADAADIVTVEISPNNGTTYYSTVRVLGNANAWWSYSAGTGVAASPYDGDASPVDFQPAGGGQRTTDGYSTIIISNLPSASQMRIRVTMLNNAGAERWTVDDVTVTGQSGTFISGYSNRAVSATSESVTGLTSGVTYYFRVRATNEFCTTGNSATQSVTTVFVQPLVEVRGNNQWIVDGDSTPTTADHTDFGAVGLNQSNIVRTYTITNSGSSSLSVGNVTTSGAAASDFVVLTQPSSPLAAAGTTTFQVRFDPSAVGTRTATIQFTNNVSTNSPYNFVVQGTGVAAGIYVSPASFSVTTMVGSAVGTQTFGVTNVGRGRLDYAITTNAAWLSVSPTSANLFETAGQQETITFSVTGLSAGTSNATITITDALASNSPQTVSVALVLTNIPAPVVLSAYADGKEMVRMGWTKHASFDVMIVHRATNAPSIPVQGQAYNIGDAYGSDGSLVIYKGSAANREHIVTPGTTNHYAFYSINNNHYSPIVSTNVAMGRYGTAEIVEQFAYTNTGTLATSGHGNGGNGWTNAWRGDNNFNISSGSLAGVTAYPSNAANKIRINSADIDGTSKTNVRQFAAITTGKVYVAYILNYQYNGANKFAGVSFMNNSTEEMFFGEGYGGDQVVAVGGNVTTSNLLAGSDYVVIGMYDFAADTAYINTYRVSSDTVPSSEPGTWHATYSDSSISRINGIRLAAGAGGGSGTPGDTYYDEIRVAQSWAHLMGDFTEPDVAVLGTNHAVITTANTPDAANGTDFGSVEYIDAFVDQTFGITNTGDGILTVTAINLTGSQASDFSIVSPTPAFNVSPGTRSNLVIRFDPSASGVRTAAVTVVNNDNDEASYVFYVQGNAPAFPDLRFVISTASVLESSGIYTVTVYKSSPNYNVSGDVLLDGTATLFADYGFSHFVQSLMTTITNPAVSAQSNNFGRGIGAVGTNVIIGAMLDDSGAPQTGAAYLYAPDGRLITTFTNPFPITGDLFGIGVGSVGTNVIIGANSTDIEGSQSGRTYLYAPDGRLITILGNTAYPLSYFFGNDVCGVETNIVIGAPGGLGDVFVYTQNGALIDVIDNPAGPDSFFGRVVAAVGTNILIGAPYDSTSNTDAGIAYLYTQYGTLITTITNPTPGHSDNFGSSVGVFGTNLLISASEDNAVATNSGIAYMFSPSGILITTFTNPAPGAFVNFGNRITGVGGYIAIGAHGADIGASQAGAVYIFAPNGTLITTITNPTPSLNDFFSNDALSAIGSDRLAIGATLDDTTGTNAGIAYIYQIGASGFTLPGATTSTTFTISITNDVIDEADETVILSLTNIYYATVVSPSNFTLTILDDDGLPIVTTDQVIPTSPTTASGGGNVTSDGGASVTNRGVVWNTTGSPTVADSRTSDGTGTGTFTSTLTNLVPGQTYYVRAYAQSTGGTGYGGVTNFTAYCFTNTSVVTGLVVTATNDVDFTLAWSNYTGATGYQLDVSTSSNFVSGSGITELFISEYVEGSGNNKFIEIYNGTGASVDLADYRLLQFNNGSASVSFSLNLSGTLTNGGVYVIENSSESLGVTADLSTSSSTMNFNGDDAMALTNVTAGGYADIIGQIGTDPGSQWGSGDESTADNTIRRMSSITAGDTDGSNSFDPVTEWDGFATDTVSGLGSHSTSGGSAPSFVPGYSNRAESVNSATVTGLTGGVTYYYRVRATNEFCTTENSATGSVTTVILGVTIQILGNNTVIADGDATPSYADHTDFGGVGVVFSNIVRTYTITNSGPGSLIIYSITTSGTAAAEFSVITMPSSPLNASNTTTFQVSFDPTGLGTRTATITVSNNAAGYTLYDFVVQGTGVASGIQGTPSSLSVTSMVGSTPAASGYGVTNVGLGDLIYTNTPSTSWMSVSPTTGTNVENQGRQHTVNFNANGLSAGVSNGSIVIVGIFASNNPQNVTVTWTLTNIPDVISASLTNDGNEMVRLYWEKQSAFDVMIVHRETNAPGVPTNNVAYTNFAPLGAGSRVIYRGSGSNLEHIVRAGSINNYAFYSINNNHYSLGTPLNTTMGSYSSGEVVEPFAYTNGVTLATRGGGIGWHTNQWQGDTQNFVVVSTSFGQQADYPTPRANKVRVTPGSAETKAVYRQLTNTYASGTMYVSYIVNFQYDGADKFAGLSLVSNNVEKLFVGEVYTADLRLGINSSSSNRVMTQGTGNDYIVILKYDWGTGVAAANAYKIGTDSVPNTEPATWDMMLGVASSTVGRINGIRIAAGAGSGTPGDVYFDEIRVSTNWSSLLMVSPGRVIYDGFATSSGSISGMAGGTGWGTNTWQLGGDPFVDYSSGTILKQKSSYYEPTGNKIVMYGDVDGRWISASRNFETALTSGVVYFSWMMNYEFNGTDKYAGLKLMEGTTEKAFIGKVTTANKALGIESASSNATATFDIENGTGKDYVIAGKYDFATRELSASAYEVATNAIAEEPSGYWDITTTQSVGHITSVSGVRFAIGGGTGVQIGDVYMDEVRVGTNWYEVTRKDGEAQAVAMAIGPTPRLLYVGTNYTTGSNPQGSLANITVTDADIVNTADPLDIAVLWSNSFGVFMTNQSANIRNLGSRYGRVNPNYDPVVLEGSEFQSIGYDNFFTNFVGFNGNTVVTTYQHRAFNITNSSFDDTYYITMSAENNNTGGGNFAAPNGAAGIEYWRALTVNTALQFFVQDDDPDEPEVFEFTVAGEGGFGDTNLTAGALAIIAVNGSPSTFDERFSFVVLRPFPAGTVVRFTDGGWDPLSNTWHRLSEFHTNSWVSPGNASIGQVIELSLQDINNSGDQVVIYQYNGMTHATNDPANVVFVNAVNLDDDGDGWDVNPIPNDNEHSGIYRGLTNGATAVSVPLGAFAANAYYTGTTVGTASDLLLEISKSNNWYVVPSAVATNLTITNYNFTVTGSGSFGWTLAVLSDQQVLEGGYAITNIARDTYSGLVATSTAFASSPYFLMYNDSSEVVVSNQFTVSFANGANTFQTMTMVAPSGNYDNIVIGPISSLVYTADTDNDRANDSMSNRFAMSIFIYDDDITPPVVGSNLVSITIGTNALPLGSLSELLAAWNFNDPTNRLGVSHGAGTLSHTLSSSAPTFAFNGSAINLVSGDIASNDVTLSGSGNIEDYMQFEVDMRRHEDLVLTMASVRSAQGYNSNIVSFSVNGGAFTNFNSNWDPPTTYALQTFDFSSIVEMDGATSVVIRITFNVDGTTGGGNTRFDNIQLNASLSRYYEVTDGTLATISDTNALKFIYNVFDAASSVARSTANDGTSMVVTVDGIYTNNASNYSNTLSSAGTTASDSTSVWAFASTFSYNWIGELYANGQSNRTIYATMSDLDNDRPGDYAAETNYYFGKYRVIDDDSNTPVVVNIRYDGFGVSTKPFYVATNGTVLADEQIRNALSRRSGEGTNTVWGLSDADLASAGTLRFVFGARDTHSLVSRGNSGTTNEVMSFSISNLISGNLANYNAGLSSAQGSTNITTTNVWSFSNGFFTDLMINTLISNGQQSVRLTVPDTDDDRPTDRGMLVHEHVGSIQVIDDDIRGPILGSATVDGAFGTNVSMYSSFETNQNWPILSLGSSAPWTNVATTGEWIADGATYGALDPKISGTRRIGILTNVSATPTWIQLPPMLDPGSVVLFAGRFGAAGSDATLRVEVAISGVWSNFGSFAITNRNPEFEMFSWDVNVTGVTTMRVVHAGVGPQIYIDDITVLPQPTWLNTNTVRVGWAVGVDDYSALDEYRVVVPNISVSIPTATNSGVGVNAAFTNDTFDITGQQGVLTGYVFAIDNDNDRFADRALGNIQKLIVRVDTNPPPVVQDAKTVVDATMDDTTEIKVTWSNYTDVARAAGWRQSDSSALSSWDTYIIRYHELDISSPVTTELTRASASWTNVLNNHMFTNMILSNLNFDARYAISVMGRDMAGNIGPMVTVTGITTIFSVTQGFNRVDVDLEVQWIWNEERTYDVVYVDGLSMSDSFSNQWQKLVTITNAGWMCDTGSATRTRPAMLNNTMRFYRVSREGAWTTNNAVRRGSTEIYVTKPLNLYTGENWHSLFFIPDTATVAYVFNTNILPQGSTFAEATKISWFTPTQGGTTNQSGMATAVVWLTTSGAWEWQVGGSGNADDKLVPLNQGFLLEIPGSNSVSQPIDQPVAVTIPLIGRIPTQSVVQVLAGGTSSSNTTHILNYNVPIRTAIANMGFRSSGLVGNINGSQADEVRILAPGGNASISSPKARLRLSTDGTTWMYYSAQPNNPSDPSQYVIEPDDAIVIIRRNAGNMTWTNRTWYTPPTKNFTP